MNMLLIQASQIGVEMVWDLAKDILGMLVVLGQVVLAIGFFLWGKRLVRDRYR